MFSLQGKVALVTGASRGIGESIAMAYADAGADVALAARSVEKLEENAGRIAAMGRRALAVACDVTVDEDIVRCVDRTVAELGAIDVLVNNAGGPEFNAPFLETRPSGWDRLIALNLTSVVRFSRQVGAHMVERGRGSIINIGSPTTIRPWPVITPYGVAKAGVLNLTQALAQEWARSGVRVNMFTPGWIDTQVNRAFVENPAAAAGIAGDVPLGRWGTTEDLLGVAIWLASDASAYVTGTNIPVDGGLTVAVPEDWRALRVERTWRAEARG